MTALLVKLFIKDADNVSDRRVRQRYGALGSAVGVFLNVLLFIGKLIASLISGSVSALADAINNLSDAGSSVVTLIGFKLAAQPSDKDHPFGHGRVEYISSFIVSILIIVMGFELGKSSVGKIIHPEMTEFSWISFAILAASIVAKLWLGLFNRKLGKMISSPAMSAVSLDSITDCISTFTVLIGMLLTKFTGIMIDGYIGLLVALFILYTGFSSVKESLDPILGEAASPELVKNITDCVLSHKEISGIHDMMVHSYGPGRYLISLHAEVPCDCNIMDIHDTIDIIETELFENLSCIATIHMDPIDYSNPETLRLKADVEKILADIDPALGLHDFRVVFGTSHTNLIFDITVPHRFKLTSAQIQKAVNEKIRLMDGNCFAITKVENIYV